MNDHSDTDDTNGDGEGVWSPDIEQCFREALLLFPPCGRRKHILQEEGGGKMYGRNELIARHIMMRTGKVRTRKQVSSHIQVLARRKAKAEAGVSGAGSSSPASSINALPVSLGDLGATRARPDSAGSRLADSEHSAGGHQSQQQRFYDVWADRPIVTQKIRLVEFSAFIEHRQPTTLSGSLGQHHHQQATPGITSQTAALTSLANAAAGADPLKLEQTNMDTTNTIEGAGPIQSPYGGPPSIAVGPLGQQPQQAPHPPHPLASNHHLPAQFNQANSIFQTNNNSQLQPLNQQHHLNHPNQDLLLGMGPTNSGPIGHHHHHNNHNHNGNHHPHIQQLHQQPAGSTRHSYVKIDYRQPVCMQTNKLERIDISQIQDKFPEIGGSEGLFQRGPHDAFFLVKFWADLNNDYEYNIEDQNSFFGFSSHFETVHPYEDITCSTKACSYGLQVIEKVEKIYGAFNNSNGRYSYDINGSPMCGFMTKFIKKLRQLPRASQMNSVLENFTVLQVITSESTSEILLCLAYVFEIASPEQNNRSQYHVYKLTKD